MTDNGGAGVGQVRVDRTRDRKLLATLLVALLVGAAVGAALGPPETAMERLGPLGGSALAGLLLTWAAISAWLGELEDDVSKARFERMDRYVKLGLPMFAAGAAWMVALTAAADVDRNSQTNVVWATTWAAAAVLLLIVVVAARRRWVEPSA